MLMIVLFHFIYHGSIPNFIQLENGFKYSDKLFYFISNSQMIKIEAISSRTIMFDLIRHFGGHSSNFIFMLISGFFLFNKTITYKNVFQTLQNLLMQIIFISFCLLIILFAANQMFAINFFLSFLNTLNNFANSAWFVWYIRCFMMFMLILPLLKLFEHTLNQERHLSICLFFWFFLSLALYFYLPLKLEDQQIRFLQFIAFYYIGGYFAKYQIANKFSITKLLFALIFLITIYGFNFYGQRTNFLLAKQALFTLNFGDYFSNSIFAMLVFLIFAKFSFQSVIINKIASTTLSTYIIHDGPYLSFTLLMAHHFAIKTITFGSYFKLMLVLTLATFILGMCLDLIRQCLVKLFKNL